MDTELMVRAALDELARGSTARAREMEARRRPHATPLSRAARLAEQTGRPAGAWRRLLGRLPVRPRGHVPA